MSNAEVGLLLFIEEPSQTAARWSEGRLAMDTGIDVVAATHIDMVENLRVADDTQVYLAARGADAETYVSDLGTHSGIQVLEVPAREDLERWDSGLSILFNRCRHPKVICADGRVPDFYTEDLGRARRKLDLYEMVVGRQDEGGCWLVGMHGYQEFLSRVKSRPEELLHTLLEAGVRQGHTISVLDTKQALDAETDLKRLGFLAMRPQHEHLKSALQRYDLLPPRPRPQA